MKTYTLQEFFFLLKLSLWTAGGEVSDLGYVSAAKEVSVGSFVAGVTGVALSSSVALEKYESSGMNRLNVTFSVYQPYDGSYIFLVVSTGYIKNLKETLFTILRQDHKTNKLSGRTLTGSPFKFRRRYVAAHTSIRTGPIATPGNRR